MHSPIEPNVLLRPRHPRINCVEFDDSCGRCNHVTGKAFFGRLPCILITTDSRIGSCKFKLEYPRPNPPPCPPPKVR